MSFTFEKLEVYQKSVGLAQRISAHCDHLKAKVTYSIIDQLLRASLSIPLNIAEGNGRWHKPDKRKYFWIARGSAFEVVPILQILKNQGHISEADYKSYYRELNSISMMLDKLIRAVEGLNQDKLNLPVGSRTENRGKNFPSENFSPR